METPPLLLGQQWLLTSPVLRACFIGEKLGDKTLHMKLLQHSITGSDSPEIYHTVKGILSGILLFQVEYSGTHPDFLYHLQKTCLTLPPGVSFQKIIYSVLNLSAV